MGLGRSLALVPIFVACVASAAGAAPQAAQPGARGVDGGPRDAPSDEGALPDEAALRALAEADVTQARGVLRRVARAGPRPAQRAIALAMLATRDPSIATGRICARALRLDAAAPVRRAAAECLGRLGPDLGAVHTPALVAALADEAVDVVTMVGWALSNIGDAASLQAVTTLASHPDERVAQLFYSFAERLRGRLGLAYEEPSSDPPGTVPPPGEIVVQQTRSLQSALASGWLGIHGVMLGWLHGSFLVAAHGGPASNIAALAGLGAAALGGSIGSSYAFLRAPDILRAHTIVQMSGLSTVAGYGLGLLSGFPPASGIAAANLGFVGSVMGTAAGIALVETSPPTASALSLGLTTGVSVAMGTLPLALGYRFPLAGAAGAAMFVGGAAGTLATVLFPRVEIGLFPLSGGLLGAGVGGIALGTLAAFVDVGQTEVSPTALTEATGWITALGVGAGFAVGTVAGGFIPRELDPLLVGAFTVAAPSLSFVPSVVDPASAVPLATWSGAF